MVIGIKTEEKEHKKRTYKPPVRAILDVPGPEQILKWVNSVDDITARACLSLLYLTAGRINEITEFQPINIKYKDRLAIIELKNLKNRNPARRRKYLPIPIASNAKCLEAEHLANILKYIKDLDPFVKPFQKWGNMSEYLARQLTIKVSGYYPNGQYAIIEKRFSPHYFRHCRSQHLTDIYDLDGTEKMFFMGWSDARQDGRYTRSKQLEKRFL